MTKRKDTADAIVRDLAKWSNKWSRCVMCHDFVRKGPTWPEHPHHKDCPIGRVRALQAKRRKAVKK